MDKVGRYRSFYLNSSQIAYRLAVGGMTLRLKFMPAKELEDPAVSITSLAGYEMEKFPILVIFFGFWIEGVFVK